MNKPVVVVGNGWAALGAVGLLARTGKQIRWVAGSGSRVLSPVPSIVGSTESQALRIWTELAQGLGVDLGGDLQTGSYLREFRNKGFRELAWMRAPTPEERKQVREELLWPPEKALTNLFDARFPLTLGEIEEEIRARLTGDNAPANVQRLEGVPVAGIREDDGMLKAVMLASGEEIETDRLIYADRWSLLPQMQGFPKLLSFNKNREPIGMLQAVFTHEFPVGEGVTEGFLGTLHKESGEDFERHVVGYFTSDGKRSFWTVPIAQSEVGDNHEIAKRLRRMKSALDKMFTGESWIPQGKKAFMENVQGEQVRFEEGFIFASGEPPLEPVMLPKLPEISFITDGYGPSSAMHQVSMLPEVSTLLDTSQRPDSQAVSVDLIGKPGIE